MNVLLVGVSVRAFAESAAVAGHTVVAVDGYGDLDLRAVADVRSIPGEYSAVTAVERAKGLACDAVAYTSNFENHPHAVARLARGRRLIGNPPDVLARARDPFLLTRILGAPRVTDRIPVDGGRWLCKPRRSGGGRGIIPWRRGVTPSAAVSVGRCVFQEYVPGVPGSIVFVAAGRTATPLAITRQIVGDTAFGSSGFRYTGNILMPPAGAVYRRAVALASAATAEFGLTGVNGLDFIVRRGMPVPIEINPRYTAAMELAERHYGVSIARAHLAGRTDLDLMPTRGTLGKAIVYARRAVTLGDTVSWLSDTSVRDISAPGTRIPLGAPICTVFAEGRDADECYRLLTERAARVYELVEAGRVAA